MLAIVSKYSEAQSKLNHVNVVIITYLTLSNVKREIVEHSSLEGSSIVSIDKGKSRFRDIITLP